jgi:RHS repeat-associated protein
MLINSSQAVVAKYLYDAFGNVLSASGLLANANLYQFSSKEKHLNSRLVYYLYRYYDPNLQRWLNRDPIAEPGFAELRGEGQRIHEDQVNFFIFDDNNPVNKVDALGLSPCIQRCINQGNDDMATCKNITKTCAKAGAVIGGIGGGVVGGIRGGTTGAVGVGIAVAVIDGAGWGFAGWFSCNFWASAKEAGCEAGCISIGPNAP